VRVVAQDCLCSPPIGSGFTLGLNPGGLDDEHPTSSSVCRGDGMSARPPVCVREEIVHELFMVPAISAHGPNGGHELATVRGFAPCNLNAHFVWGILATSDRDLTFARMASASVTFEPGARTVSHMHPLEQTSAGRVALGRPDQRDSARRRDLVSSGKASARRESNAPMTHIAIQEKLDGPSQGLPTPTGGDRIAISTIG
jgi:hypothetical protein